MFLKYSVNDITFKIEKSLPLFYSINECNENIYKNFIGVDYNGEILLNDNEYKDFPILYTPISVIPKHLGLYPHMDVLKNIKLKLDLKNKTNEEQIMEKAVQAGVAQYLERISKQLDFTQKRIVVVFRAFLNHPQLIIINDILDTIEQNGDKLLDFMIKMIDMDKIPIIYLNSSNNNLIRNNSIILA
jgi:ABC-type sugar transport system ATPase subunit